MIVKECPCTCENSIVEEYQDQECSMTPWGTPYGITFFYVCLDCEESWEHHFLIPSADLDQVFKRTTTWDGSA